jgi:hypothetical protein
MASLRTQRAVARELEIARVTVRKYLDQAVPSRKRATPRPQPACRAHRLQQSAWRSCGFWSAARGH